MSRLTRGPMSFLPVRGYHPLWPTFPSRSRSYSQATGLVRVRSPLLTEYRLISFPPGTEMFQFPGFALLTLCVQVKSTWFTRRSSEAMSELPRCAQVRSGFSQSKSVRWVSPFGHPGIKGCSRLPRAYRRVPRPSSPLAAKASTKRPYRA